MPRQTEPPQVAAALPPTFAYPKDDHAVAVLMGALARDPAAGRAALALIFADPDAEGADIVFRRLTREVENIAAFRRSLDGFQNAGFSLPPQGPSTMGTMDEAKLDRQRPV